MAAGTGRRPLGVMKNKSNNKFWERVSEEGSERIKQTSHEGRRNLGERSEGQVDSIMPALQKTGLDV